MNPAGGGSRILDAGRYRPPIKTHLNDEGETVIEKVPGTRHRLMVSPAGNLVRLSITNANAAAEPALGQYAYQIQARKQAVGFFPADTCPLALVAAGQLNVKHLPKPMRKSKDGGLPPPCQPGSYHADKPCPHTVEVIAFRQKKQVDLTKRKEVQHKSEATQLLEAQERRHQEMMEALVAKAKG